MSTSTTLNGVRSQTDTVSSDHAVIGYYMKIKKVKQSRYTPWRRLGERSYSSYSFSTSALDRGEWSASRPGRAFTPGERTPGTHCTGGWVGPRVGMDTEARGKILCPRRGSNPDRPVVQPVARHYTDWATRLTITWRGYVLFLTYAVLPLNSRPWFRLRCVRWCMGCMPLFPLATCLL
jgi:hypothetical protein